MYLRSFITESLGYSAVMLRHRLNRKWNDFPFGRQPRAPAEKYRELFEIAKNGSYPDIDQVEKETGFAVDRAWLDNLALHTQITIKTFKGSTNAYPHGRLLYSLLRQYIATYKPPYVQIIETGTARGFSSLCMAKALEDAGVDGRIVTVDLLPHIKPMFWNCIDDHEGPKSRAELLAPWSDLTKKIVFMQGNTLSILPKIGMDRVNFAFLDARHITLSVMGEFNFVEDRQQHGDMIVFDDVTPGLFPGVVKAVEKIEASGNYDFRRLSINERRGYAWANRK